GPREGLLSQVRLRYHGQTHLRPGELGRRVELTSRIRDGRVQYHPDWPEVTDFSGEVAVAGQTVRVMIDQAVSAGARLGGTRAVMRDQASYVDIDLDARIETQAALQFARDTPLRERLTFVGPDWTGAGNLHLFGNLHVPLGESQNDETADELGVDLFATMIGTNLEMPDYRLEVNNLEGRIRYRYPNSLRGHDITGSLFGNDVVIGADSDADTMTLHFAGRASHEDVLGVIDMEDPEVFSGSLDFTADLHIATIVDQPTRLDVRSDLAGMAVMMPGEFNKEPDLARPIEVSLEFLDEYQVVSFRHGSAKGWLHVNDKPLRGAVGFATAPAVLDDTADYLLLTGRVDGFALEEVVPDDGDAGAVLLPLRLVDLHVNHIDVDDFRIDDAVLNGSIAASGFAISVASHAVSGDLRQDGDQPLLVNLETVVIPESPEGEDSGDPLRPQIIAELPQAIVEIHSLHVGDLDYGHWNFDLEPRPDGVLLANLDAELRGVKIIAPQGVMWFEESNESRFQGELQTGNLAEVLPLWDFSASLETKSASLVGDLRWAGSPANVDLDILFGEASVRAEEGHFVDVDSGGGAMRIFSLINFNAIAKRMRGDFSDVTGKGISFDKLKAKVAFNGGSLTFVEPMKVKGTGSSFEVAGTVDLVNGTLDNEVIVTLPVTKSLPWYAAYVALANPLVGAGILVGERVLRRPIEQFSSAKYAIGGTLDEPDVNLVSVFDTSIESAKNEDSAAQRSDQPVVDGMSSADDQGEPMNDDSEVAH
ncbi:MAG: AsmA-like C-terminal region-containing protein, partial [Pseudomonadales bacterium]